jgi:TRAP transporter TAXI family solute receptor
MKKSKIRIIALLLALTIILAACGDTGTTSAAPAEGDAASAGDSSGEFTGNDLIPVIDGVGEIMAGSATTAGWSYLYMSSAATIINKYNDNMNITAQITTGGGENLMRVATNDMAMGVAQATYISDWYNGNEEQGVEAHPHLRTIYAAPFSIFSPIVRTDSPYQTLADLKGQPVSIDSKGGSSEYMNHIIFQALGMDDGFFDEQYLTCAESKDGMITGTIEGYIGSCADPHSATAEIFNMPGGARLLNLSQEEIDKICAYSDAIKPCVREAGVYKGQDEPYNSVGAAYMIIATDDFPEEYAYQIAKTLHEHYDEWLDTFSGAKGSTAEQTINTAVAPLHDGVARYFKEIGLME